VAPDQSQECFARLDEFVSVCAHEGIKNVRLYHKRGTSKAGKSRLADFAEMKRLDPPTTSPPRSKGKNDDCSRFRSDTLRRRQGCESDWPPARYRFCVEHMERAVDRLHIMTALVSASEDLDSRSTLLLRLCVYELAQNTVEHGTFTAAPPMIRLELTFSGERMTVKYGDNADVFLTTSPVFVDLVEERINTNTKRGLGLYMLNKICKDFDYERSNDWNTTSFSLELNRERETATKR